MMLTLEMYVYAERMLKEFEIPLDYVFHCLRTGIKQRSALILDEIRITCSPGFGGLSERDAYNEVHIYCSTHAKE